MEQYFGGDARRIAHARKVTEYAEQLLESEPGDPEVVVAAAVFHDIGIPEAERKYGSAAGHLQEQEGPPIAREILARFGLPEEVIQQACDIIAHHHSPGALDSPNFRIIWDADWLVNLAEQVNTSDQERASRLIDKVFTTLSGKRLAKRIYLGQV